MYHGIEILGRVTPDRLAAHPPERAEDPDGVHLEVDCSDLEPLNLAYREFVWERVPEDQEWDSTSAVIEYLSMNVMEIRLLGFQPSGADEFEWSLDIVFSSSGGMTQVSGQVAAHWAQIWMDTEGSAIEEVYFRPFGFVPSGQSPALIGTPDVEIPRTRHEDRFRRRPVFVPIAGASYAAMIDGQFCLNVATLERLGDAREQLFSDLAAVYGGTNSPEQCRCQFCAPDFDPGVRLKVD